MNFYQKYLKYKQKYLGSKDFSFINNLRWRRSEKHFLPGKVDLEHIDDAIINSPSSYGLQTYKVIRITNPDVKKSLKEACYNQPQIEECYALYIFCALKDYKKRIEQYIQQTGQSKKKDSMIEFIENQINSTEWSKHQTYIALSFGMAAAMEQKIASCPMEGFDPNKIEEVLKLDSNLRPCVLLTVGKHKTGYQLEPRFRFDDIIDKID